MATQAQTSLVSEVEHRIQAALELSAADAAQHIHVKVDGDRAVLDGTLRSWAEHEDAEAAALSTPGIATVDNRVALLVKAKLSKSSV